MKLQNLKWNVLIEHLTEKYSNEKYEGVFVNSEGDKKIRLWKDGEVDLEVMFPWNFDFIWNGIRFYGFKKNGVGEYSSLKVQLTIEQEKIQE